MIHHLSLPSKSLHLRPKMRTNQNTQTKLAKISALMKERQRTHCVPHVWKPMEKAKILMDSSVRLPTAIRDRRLVSITLLSSRFLQLKSSIERIKAGLEWGQGGRRGGRWGLHYPSEAPCREGLFDLLTHLGVISNTSLTCHLPILILTSNCLEKKRKKYLRTLAYWMGNLGNNWPIPVMVWAKPSLA